MATPMTSESRDAARGPDIPARATTANFLIKFAIGAFASLCAVFLPKIIVFLKNDGSGDLITISRTYIIAGVLFALLIGVIIAIFEFRTRRTPAQTFMAALGIPALVSGTLDTVGTADNLALKTEQFRQLAALTAQTANVPILDKTLTLPAPGSDKQSAVFELVSSAVAAEPGAIVIAQQSAYGVQAVRRQFLVVLHQSSTRAEADAQANTLKSKVPNVTVVPGGHIFYVTTSGSPMSEVDALQQAVRLREAGLTPSLLPVSR